MNEKEEAVSHKKRWYCPPCLEEKRKKEENKHNDPSDWDQLYEYIKELYGHPPTGIMFKQLGTFRKPPYNYTNMGMLLTLQYFHETLGNEVLTDGGVGIIPYVYEEAKKNFIKNKEVNKFNFECDYSPMLKIKRIKVKPTNHIQKKSLIDFKMLEDEDE
jgi:hypothetical protein